MPGWSLILVVLGASPASDALSFSLQLDHILSPPPMPCRKCSNPDLASGPGKSLKFKSQLSEDGRQLRRGSLGGALTGESPVICVGGILFIPWRVLNGARGVPGANISLLKNGLASLQTMW